MIDIEELRAHYQGREEMIGETFLIFLEDAPKALDRLETALEASDRQGAVKAAHTLANLCGVIRASGAVDHARALQGALAEGETGAAVKRRFEELARDIEGIGRFIADQGYGT
jgi:HPt (histidine-containing phosphotransfer) domain-containing protein